MKNIFEDHDLIMSDFNIHIYRIHNNKQLLNITTLISYFSDINNIFVDLHKPGLFTINGRKFELSGKIYESQKKNLEEILKNLRNKISKFEENQQNKTPKYTIFQNTEIETNNICVTRTPKSLETIIVCTNSDYKNNNINVLKNFKAILKALHMNLKKKRIDLKNNRIHLERSEIKAQKEATFEAGEKQREACNIDPESDICREGYKGIFSLEIFRKYNPILD